MVRIAAVNLLTLALAAAVGTAQPVPVLSGLRTLLSKDPVLGPPQGFALSSHNALAKLRGVRRADEKQPLWFNEADKKFYQPKGDGFFSTAPIPRTGLSTATSQKPSQIYQADGRIYDIREVRPNKNLEWSPLMNPKHHQINAPVSLRPLRS